MARKGTPRSRNSRAILPPSFPVAPAKYNPLPIHETSPEAPGAEFQIPCHSLTVVVL
jgi:hypothetical protein